MDTARIKPSGRRLEILWALVLVAILFIQHWENLVTGTRTFTGDTLVWGYPGFYFFTHQIWNGAFPLWSPYSHGGEPFYPILLQRRLLEPSTWILVGFARLFSPRPTLLFNWHLFFQSAIMASGTYWLLRRYATATWVRLLLMTAVALSSFCLSSFRQIGCISQFLWLPWVFFYSIEIFWKENASLKNCLGLTLFFGLNCQSYWFSGSAVILLFVVAASLVFKRQSLIRSIWPRQQRKNWMLVVLLLGIFNLPNLAVFLERDRFVYPLRMVPEEKDQSAPAIPLQTESGPEHLAADLSMDWAFVKKTGSPGTVWDLLQAASPTGNRNSPGSSRWGEPTAAFLYLGLFTWALVFIGIFNGRNEDRSLWVIIGLGSTLLLLGPIAGLHGILHFIFPPMRYLRHTLPFIVPLTLCAFYFLVLGANRIEGWLQNRERAFPRWALYCLCIQLLIVLHFHPDKASYLFTLVWRLALPLALLGWGRRYRHVILAGIIFVVTFDLTSARYDWGVLYREQSDPFQSLAASDDYRRPDFIASRKVTPAIPSIPDADSEQTIRYLANLYRRPFALSEIYTGPDPINAPRSHELDFAQAIQMKRWNSYHLLKSYFETIHSSRSIEQKKSDLGIERSAFELNGIALPVADWNYNRIHLTIPANHGTQIQWNEAWDPHWKAYADGKEIPVTRSRFLKSLSVEPNTKELTLIYRPTRFLISVLLFWSATLFCILGMRRFRWR